MGARRSIRALAVGGLIVIALLAVARFTDGLVAASAFIVGLFAIPVAFGIAVAYAWHALELRRSVPGLSVRRSMRDSGVRTCLTCLEPMHLEGDTWTCLRCSDDRAIV